MPKINQEEYEILKGLDDKWKWIARDTLLLLFTNKAYKTNEWGMNIISNLDTYEELQESVNDDNLFDFIQWEDSEPYNIAELIEEYEFENVLSDEERFYELYNVKESEETEVKTDIEWLENEVRYEYKRNKTSFVDTGNKRYGDRAIAFSYVLKLINQLDESEVLSQEWISEHMYYVDDWDSSMVYVSDLQNLLVPKQEKVIIEGVWAKDIEEAKASGMTLFKAMNWMAISSDDKEKQDLFARAWLDGYTVVEEPKYIIDTDDIEISDGNHYLTNLTLSKDSVKLPIVGDKFDAIRFDDINQAEAIASYVGGRVKELEE